MKTIVGLAIALATVTAATRLLLSLAGVVPPFGVQLAWAGTLLAGSCIRGRWDRQWWAASIPLSALVWALGVWLGPTSGLGAGLAVVAACTLATIERSR